MGLAFNTLAWLEEKSANVQSPETRYYLELHASQWKELNYAYPAFAVINERLDDISEDLYEAGLTDDELSQFFVKVVTRAIQARILENGLLQYLRVICCRVCSSATHRRVTGGPHWMFHNSSIVQSGT